jgi:hypothetical protein
MCGDRMCFVVQPAAHAYDIDIDTSSLMPSTACAKHAVAYLHIIAEAKRVADNLKVAEVVCTSPARPAMNNRQMT